jgi:hypothetical protein
MHKVAVDREMELATKQQLFNSAAGSMKTSLSTTGYESQIGLRQLEDQMRKSDAEYEQIAGGDAGDVGGAAAYWLAGQHSEQPGGIQRGLQKQMGLRTARNKDGRHISSLDNRTVSSHTKGNRFYRGDLHAEPRRRGFSVRNTTPVSEVVCLDCSDEGEDHRPTKRVVEGKEDTPPRFSCPITRQMYRDPVVASDGFTYERFALQRLLSGPRIPESPLTRERLDLQMFPNRDMQQQVEDWLSRQPLPHIYGIEHGRRESLLEFSSGPSYSHASVQLTEHAHRESSRSFSSGPSHTHTPSVRQSDDAGETSGASSVPYHMYDLSDESDHCHGLSRSSKFDYTMMSHGSHASTRESHDFLCHDAYDASNDVHSGDETGSESATVRLAFQRPHVQEARAESQQQSCGGCSEESSEPNNMTALRAARLARFDKK